jgi:3-deoxy-7-phosphoheptulonate synthase
MAGPCAVETEGQLLETARSVARAGARVLRGGAFKPRTSPYSFQGLGERGLELLAKAREVTGLPVVTEVMSDTQAHLVAAYADMLQIGSRSMENEALLRAAARTGRPILLKRGMVATIEEMIEAAEFLAGNGAEEIVLCERGIRTYGTATRNTCDIAAIPLLKKLTGLPVILDPSHASGRRDLVPALSKAGVAVGADGLLIEVHHHAEAAWSDAEQTLGTADFEELLAELQPHLRIWKEARSAVFATRA